MKRFVLYAYANPYRALLFEGSLNQFKKFQERQFPALARMRESSVSSRVYLIVYEDGVQSGRYVYSPTEYVKEVNRKKAVKELYDSVNI